MNNNTRKNTVILFNPLSSQRKGHRGAPLSLLAIAAPLEQQGYKIKIVDAHVEDDYIIKISEYISDALCIGITCMTGPQIKGALEIARVIKEKMPTLPIVFGGWHATILPDQTLNNELIDIVVRGRGEQAFKEILESLKDNEPLADIKGISYKESGKVISNEDRPAEDINNTYPLPYHLLDNIEKYIYEDWYAKRILSYVTSFGCPHRCKFCAESNMSHHRWNGLKAERVIEEIDALVKKYKLDGVALYDSNFFVNEARTKQICQGLIKNKIKWGNANGSVSILLKYSPETWSLLERSGCSEILIGVESGDDDILKFLNKGDKAKDIIGLKEITHKYNINLWISLMLGIPFDLSNPKSANKREFKAFARIVKDLYKISNTDRFALFIYTPYPGTYLYEYAIKNGVKVPEKLKDWSEFSLNTINIPWLDKKYFKLADYLSNFIFTYSKPLNCTKDDMQKQSLAKRIYLNICHFIVSYRVRHGFYAFNLEFRLIKLIKSLLINKKFRSMLE